MVEGRSAARRAGMLISQESIVHAEISVLFRDRYGAVKPTKTLQAVQQAKGTLRCRCSAATSPGPCINGGCQRMHSNVAADRPDKTPGDLLTTDYESRIDVQSQLTLRVQSPS